MFLFEFVVVLLGVMAAQAVADWADDRRLTREATEQFEQARLEATNVARIQHHWRRVGKCLSERALSVARAAAAPDVTLAATAIGRPSLPVTTMPVWDPDVRRAAIARFSRTQMSAIDYFENRAMVLAETSIKVRDAWSTFAMLDPANGSPSDVDRANVRLAAVSAIDHIRLLGFADPADAMADLGVPEAEWKQSDFQQGLIDECGLIKTWR